jgi:hypothetical protein
VSVKDHAPSAHSSGEAEQQPAGLYIGHLHASEPSRTQVTGPEQAPGEPQRIPSKSSQ